MPRMEVATPLPLIPQIDLAAGPPGSAGLTREQLSYLGCVYFAVKDSDLDQLFNFLQRHTGVETYADVSAISSNDDIISILDAGVRKIFVQARQLEKLRAYGDRVLSVVAEQGNDLPATGGALVTGKDTAVLKTLLEKCKAQKISPIFIAATGNAQASLDLAREFSATTIIPATQMTVEQKAEGDVVSIPAFIGSCWTSDRTDKLIPTVVTDERGVALGLVYSSEESMAESLKTGTGKPISRTMFLLRRLSRAIAQPIL